jgi:class 3 adenylate cyclase
MKVQMSTEIIIAVIGLLITVASVTAGVVMFLMRRALRTDKVFKELEKLRTKNAQLEQQLEQQVNSSDPSAFNKIRDLMKVASDGLAADKASIYFPQPMENPSQLKIVFSNDRKWRNIVGREIPLSEGICGWVYKSKEPYIQNNVASDPLHFDKVDKAAGTQVDAILTLPLLYSGRCHGVVQFMKENLGTFAEEDIIIASQWLPALARHAMALEADRSADLHLTARLNQVTGTVLFSDIKGFSKIASKVTLGVTVALLNEYYSRLLTHVLNSGGRLEEYVGDGLYVSFFLDSAALSAQAAVTAAIKMQQEYGEVVTSWRRYQHPVSEKNFHGIGVSTGVMNRSKVGTEEARREKLIGSPVNRSAHLCIEAKQSGNRILICEDTARLIIEDGFQVSQFQSTQGSIYEVMFSAM